MRGALLPFFSEKSKILGIVLRLTFLYCFSLCVHSAHKSTMGINTLVLSSITNRDRNHREPPWGGEGEQSYLKLKQPKLKSAGSLSFSFSTNMSLLSTLGTRQNGNRVTWLPCLAITTQGRGHRFVAMMCY